MAKEKKEKREKIIPSFFVSPNQLNVKKRQKKAQTY